jgi:hypothetical protein
MILIEAGSLSVYAKATADLPAYAKATADYFMNSILSDFTTLPAFSV